MTDSKFLIADHSQNWRDADVQLSQNLQLIEGFDINFIVKQSIQPSNLALTTIKYVTIYM